MVLVWIGSHGVFFVGAAAEAVDVPGGIDVLRMQMPPRHQHGSGQAGPNAFHCLRARNFAISDDLLAFMLISCGNC